MTRFKVTSVYLFEMFRQIVNMHFKTPYIAACWSLCVMSSHTATVENLCCPLWQTCWLWCPRSWIEVFPLICTCFMAEPALASWTAQWTLAPTNLRSPVTVGLTLDPRAQRSKHKEVFYMFEGYLFQQWYITPVLAAIHWLPVSFRIEFKVFIADF